jgi:3-isopropylmalate/(R)-2-methylmalate dehydratase small subunit
VQNGIRAVVSTSFADIFKGNAVKNGLLPVVVPADAHKRLINSPGMKVAIDLAAQTLTLADGSSIQFPIDSFAKRCMLDGVDELGYMLNQEAAIAAFEAKHPPLINTLA